MSKAITLVLGGMGVKGVASVGILQSLDKHNIKIKRIIASGISGLVCGQYAMDKDLNLLSQEFVNFFKENHRYLWGLEQLSGMFQSRRQRAVESFSYFLRERLFCRTNFKSTSVLPWEVVEPQLCKFFNNETFADLKIPLAISAIDIKKDRPVLLDSGKLYESMKASIAFPGLFPPMKIGDMELVSSTLYSELPLENVLKKDAPVLVINNASSVPRHDIRSLLEVIAITGDIRSIAIEQQLLKKADYVLQLKGMAHFRWGSYKQIPQMIAQARRETDVLLDSITLP
jgi:NTE family protein